MLDQKIELLQRTALLGGLPLEKLEAIAEAGEKTYFEAGEHLIQQGAAGDVAFLIMTGKASCTKIEKGQSFVEDLWPGTLVGELGMLVETVHTITVTASERLRALALKRDAIRAAMEEHPEIAYHISTQLLKRLHSLAVDLRKVDSKLAEVEAAA